MSSHSNFNHCAAKLPQRFVEFEIDIDPVSLVSRIVSVREQIAGEWVKDLETLRNVNEMILDSYYKTQDEERKTNSTNATAPQTAYDRGAMLVLGNHIMSEGKASSPFRKGNFDLLGLLATQESIHRVLREYSSSEGEREISFMWLRDFYFARLATHFDGAQQYGRADDFLGELLLTAPSMKQIEDTLGLIDPNRIAEDIIAMRSVVAQEWRDTITEVLRTDHETLRTSIVTVQMDRRFDEAASIMEEQESFFEQGFQ